MTTVDVRIDSSASVTACSYTRDVGTGYQACLAAFGVVARANGPAGCPLLTPLSGTHGPCCPLLPSSPGLSLKVFLHKPQLIVVYLVGFRAAGWLHLGTAHSDRLKRIYRQYNV